MKYAYFADICFIFVLFLSFYLTRSAAAWSGFVLFCFVLSLGATYYHRGCLIILLFKGVCAWETKFERANRHFSESNRYPFSWSFTSIDMDNWGWSFDSGSLFIHDHITSSTSPTSTTSLRFLLSFVFLELCHALIGQKVVWLLELTHAFDGMLHLRNVDIGSNPLTTNCRNIYTGTFFFDVVMIFVDFSSIKCSQCVSRVKREQSKRKREAREAAIRKRENNVSERTFPMQINTDRAGARAPNNNYASLGKTPSIAEDMLNKMKVSACSHWSVLGYLVDAHVD